MNKVRVYYCRNRDERSKWLHHLKTAIGYSQIEDFYEIQVRHNMSFTSKIGGLRQG